MEKAIFGNPLNISTLVKGPGAVEAALVIAGFYMHETGEPELIGGAKQLNDGLEGLIMKVRTDGTFCGKVGKTFLFAAPPNTIPAKNVMLIGLGEKQKFTLDKMKTAGCMALRNAVAASFNDIAFASEVMDGDVTTFTTLQVAEAFTEGVMNEYMAMLSKNEKGIQISSLKVLADPAHEADAKEGINMALAKYQPQSIKT